MLRVRVGITPAITITLAMAGCADLSATQGRSYMRSLFDSRAGPGIVWPTLSQTRTETDQRVNLLLNQPVSPDTAVQIAVLRNPRMQIEYERLGVTEADVLEASRISNPTLSVSVLEPRSGNASALIDGGLMQGFSDLVLLRSRKRLAAGEYQRAQLLIASAILELLLAKQQQYDAYQGYLEAVRDYWLARIDLMRTVGAPTIGPEEYPSSDTREEMHHMHDMHDMKEIESVPPSTAPAPPHAGDVP